MSYRLDWKSGPSAQIEILQAPPPQNCYVLKYASPYRATIRPPMDRLDLTQYALDQIGADCDRIEKLLGVGGRYAKVDEPEENIDAERFAQATDLAQQIGDQLHTLCLTNDVRADLRTAPLHIELGLEEALLHKNWELLFDGDNFLSLKHYMARFVNSAQPVQSGTMQNRAAATGVIKPLRILLISVPQPLPRDGRTYPRSLKYAVAETEAIRKLLEPYQDDIQVVPFVAERATKTAIQNVLGKGQFHIIHFNGHAYFDPKDPASSKLALYDADVDTGWVRGYIRRSGPALCFINACESAAPGAGLFGLARAFLDTGAYLIGSPWRVGDQAASEFATEFYDRLLLKEEPIGAAVMNARNACKNATGATDFGWASYVYYGDPRVAFCKV